MENLLPLKFGLTPEPSPYDALDAIVPPFEPVCEAVKNTVHTRDGHTCRYCGFEARKYQQAVALEGDPRDVDAVVTACIFCHQARRIDIVTLLRSGVLLWLPEVGQVELHHMAREIYLWRVAHGPKATRARRVLDVLMQRRVAIREQFGSDDPFILARRLRKQLDGEHDAQLTKTLPGLRLFPLDRRIIRVREANIELNQFPQIFDYWRSPTGPFVHKSYPGVAELEARLLPADVLAKRNS
jgi:intracellular multiplication protein IcmJ